MALSELEGRLSGAIAGRAGEMLDTLAAWVAVPTGGGHAEGLDRLRGIVTRRLAGLGASVRLEAGDERPAWILGEGVGGAAPPPVAVCERPTGRGRKVMLCGHLDTVHDPRGAFRELTVTGAKATGPGAADMKGGILVAVVALEALAACGVELDWAFALNSDEETGSYCSQRVLREAARGRDVGLVFEPALPDGSLVVERPGSGQFAVRAIGRPAHVGRDFKSGVSAINALAEKVLAIAGRADPDRGRIVNVGVIRGGQATNIVAEEAWAFGNVRFGGAEAERELTAAIEGLAGAASNGARVEVMTSFARPVKPMTPGVEALARLARACAEDLGQRLPFGKTGGVCDGNNIQAAGVPVIDTLGVRGGGLHTPEEWVEVASLVERAQLAAVLMARLAAG